MQTYLILTVGAYALMHSQRHRIPWPAGEAQDFLALFTEEWNLCLEPFTCWVCWFLVGWDTIGEHEVEGGWLVWFGLSKWEASLQDQCSWILHSSYPLRTPPWNENNNDWNFIIELYSVCVCVCVCVLAPQSCLALCNPMDCSLPSYSVHVILQARILFQGLFPIQESNWALLCCCCC